MMYSSSKRKKKERVEWVKAEKIFGGFEIPLPPNTTTTGYLGAGSRSNTTHLIFVMASESVLCKPES